MTRQIKFRGKRIDTGEWVYGYYVYMDNRAKIYNHDGVHIVDITTVGQYTGLKDKTGREIFEGDILDIDGDIVEVKPLEVIQVDAFTVYGYDFCSGYLKEDGLNLERFYSSEPKIIGNIYENPELLSK